MAGSPEGTDRTSELSGGLSAGLDSFPLPRALAELAETGGTGTIKLRAGSLEKTLIIKDGAPVHADSNIAEEALDKFLVNRGEVEEKVALEAMGTAVMSARNVGEVLVEMGALRPDQLFKALKRSLGARILSAFAWENGELIYDADEPDIARKVLMRISPAPLVFRGVCSYTPIEIVRGNFDGAERTYQMRPGMGDTLSELRLNTIESRIANALAKGHTCASLADAARVDEADALRVLYALTLLRVAGPVEEVAPEIAAAAREHTAHQEAVLEQATRREAARKEAARAKAARQQAAREQAAREQAAREQAARAETAREQVVQEAAARIRAAEAEAARQEPTRTEPVSAAAPSVNFASRTSKSDPAIRVVPNVKPAVLSEAECDAIDRIYLTSKSRDYFDLLGVAEDATFGQLKRAFLELCDRFSPMSYRHQDTGDHADRLEEIFLTLVRAFSTLAVPASRKDYIAQTRRANTRAQPSRLARNSAARPGPGQLEEDARRNAFEVDEPPGAPVAIKTAVTLINANQAAAAAEGLRQAVLETPDDSCTHAFLGYALFLADPVSGLSEAVRHLQQAMAVDSRCLYAFLFLGRIYEVQQDRANALGAYSECLRIDPKQSEATQAVARLELFLGQR